MRRRSLVRIGIIACYLISLCSLSSASDKADPKRQAFIEKAAELCFKSDGWKIQETDPFIMFSQHSGRSLKKKLEKYFDDFCSQVARRIGYKDFQLYRDDNSDWDKKFKFLVYGTQESWRQAKQKYGVSDWGIAWAGGDRTIFFYHLDVDEKTILHEVAHEIYREYIRHRKIPVWWSEGIAQFSELSKSEIREKIKAAKFRVANNTHIPLAQLTSYDIKEYDLIYDQGLSVVVFLRSKYGASSFDTLNKAMRDGKEFESALAGAYGVDFTTINQLNKAWENALRDTTTWKAISNSLSTILEEL